MPLRKECQRNISIAYSYSEDSVRIWNSLPIDPATLAASVKIAERQNVYTPNYPVGKRGDKVDEGERKTTAEDFGKSQHECIDNLI